MKARLAAAGLRQSIRGGVPHDPAAQTGAEAGESASARVAAARARALERGDRQRQALRPVGVAFIVIVVLASVQAHPAPGPHGAGLGIAFALVVYTAAVACAISVRWAHRGLAAQAGVIAVIGAAGVALAAWQPNGPADLAATMGVWFAAVRLPAGPAAVAAGAITGSLALAVGLTGHPPVQSAVTVALVCLLLAVTGQFLRRGRESQDRAELLLAQLQDAREAEAAAAALAERSRIAGELHDVLAHSLSGLAIQLQGARKLAEREPAGAALRGAIERSAELAKAGLSEARQAVGALRGDRLPTLEQLSALVEDFRRDTGADATLLIDGPRRPLPAEASLALYRGAQEALTNIARYAPDASIAITVRYQPDRTQLIVEDHVTGVGTPRDAVLADAGGGHGLTAMRERASRVGGTARAGPTADGWLVELEVPA